MTKEQKNISYHNYKIAKEHFNLQKGWVLHHINPDWKVNDIDRYIQWNFEDLVPMTKGDHQRLHIQLAVDNDDTAKYNSWDNHTEEQKDSFRYSNLGKTMNTEWRKKISDSNKGKHNHSGANNPNYGKKHPGVGGRPKKVANTEVND